jgi:hypothetical protein
LAMEKPQSAGGNPVTLMKTPSSTTVAMRRMSISRRAAILALLAAPLGNFKAFAQERGWLTIDLAQWHGIKVRNGKATFVITAAEIAAALKEDA